MAHFREFTDRDAFNEGAAGFIEGALRARLKETGTASLVLSGGRTPGAIYEKLSRADLEWPRVMVTLSDDRDVPSTSPYSNAALVRQTLLKDEAAHANYVELVPGVIDQKVLPFDMVVLGMGEDGHIASLFPAAKGVAAVLDPSATPACVALVPDPLPVEAPYSRLTLTLSALLASRAILLLLTGEAKRCIYERAAEGKQTGSRPVCGIVCQKKVPVSVFWTP
jgi:6-phosphogluconolactonase